MKQRNETKLSILTMAVIALSAISFGWWFASNQITAVLPDAMQTYPMQFFLLTIVKCALTIIAFFLASSILLTFLSGHKIKLLAVAISFLTLTFCSVVHPFYLIVLAILAITIMLIISGYSNK